MKSKVQNRFGPVPKYLACWFKYSRPHQTNDKDIEIGCKLRLQQMSFLFHFHMLTLKTSLFKQFSWWCAILFFKPVWRASFWKIQKFREKEVGKWFLKWKTFLRRWNWEEKSSTIYHCTVFGWVIKSVLPFVLLRVWFKYSRWHKKLFNTDFWFLNPVKMFWLLVQPKNV